MGNKFSFKSNKVAPEVCIADLEQKVSELEVIIRNLNFMIYCLKERWEINSKIQDGIIKWQKSEIDFLKTALGNTQEQLRAALHINNDNGPA